MKKGLVITLSVLAVIVLVAAGGFLYLARKPTYGAYEDPVPLETRQTNTAAAFALEALGIRNYSIDVDAERIALAFEAPEGFAPGPNATLLRAVLATGAGASPNSTYAVAVQVHEGAVIAKWALRTSEYAAYRAGSLTLAELEAKISKE